MIISTPFGDDIMRCSSFQVDSDISMFWKHLFNALWCMFCAIISRREHVAPLLRHLTSSSIQYCACEIVSDSEKYGRQEHSPRPASIHSPRGMAGRQPSPQPPSTTQPTMISGSHPGSGKQLISSSHQSISSLAASHQTMTNLLSSRLGMYHKLLNAALPIIYHTCYISLTIS